MATALSGLGGCGDSGSGGSGNSNPGGGDASGGADSGGGGATALGGASANGGASADGGGANAGGGAEGGAGPSLSANGEPCAVDAECESAACSSGVCCNTTCEGACEACDLQGFAGQCSPVAAGPNHDCAGACDGQGWCETGAPLWSKAFGSDGKDMVTATAVAPNGDWIVAGSFSGSVDFGGGPLVAHGTTDLFVARFSPSGEHIWSKRFGEQAAEGWLYARVDSQGDIVLETYMPVDFGGGLPVGGANLMLAKLDGQGNHLWSKGFLGSISAGSLVLTSDDHIVLGGRMAGTVSLGGPSLVSAGGFDIFVAKFDPTGAHEWSQRFGDAAGQCPGGCYASVDAQGNVYSYGSFDGVVNFGGGSFTASTNTNGFLAKFSPTGAHLWSKGYVGPTSTKINQVVTDSNDNPILMIRLGGSFDFGGGLMTSVGGTNLAVIKLDAQGAFLDSKLFSATEIVTYSAQVDDHDNLVFIGSLKGSTDFGGGAITSVNFNHFVAKLNADLSHSFSHGYDANGVDSSPIDVAVNKGNGSVLFGGGFDQAASFGGAVLTPNNLDAYIVSLEP